MSTPIIVSLGLLFVLVLTLPMWRHSRMWGGGYTLTLFAAFALGAHIFTTLMPAGK